ncbi:hypothetical protein MKX01_015759 [Papaver californicum]|nr:hypothetical protein MKX01_015759 [Papaver californicum]
MAKSRSSFLIPATPVSIVAHLLAIAAITLVCVWIFHFQEGVAFKSETKAKDLQRTIFHSYYVYSRCANSLRLLLLQLHPFLMVIGLIVMGGEGIMAYKTVPSSSRKMQKLAHLIFLLIALVSGILGVFVAFKFHHEVRVKNMNTLHSWLGMITICLFGFVGEWLFAFFSFLYPGAGMPTRARLVPWHAFVGMVTFLLAICTAETGLLQTFFGLELVTGAEALVVNFTGLIILLFGVAVGLTAILPRA